MHNSFVNGTNEIEIRGEKGEPKSEESMMIGVDRISLCHFIILTMFICSVKPECNGIEYCKCTSDGSNDCGIDKLQFRIKATETMIQMTCINYNEEDYIKLIANMSSVLKRTKKSELEIEGCPFPNVSFVEIFKNLFTDNDHIFKFIFTIDQLEENGIKISQKDLFKNMTNLKELCLRKNKLQSLPDGIFDPLKNLERLNLNDNNLDNLPGSIFSSLNRLVDLDLSNNNMTILNDGIFDNLINLENLKMANNKLIRVPEMPFVNNSKISNIHLNNAFNKENFALPPKFFTGQKSLKFLYLDSNNLISLPEDIFRYDNSDILEYLYLEGNKLSKLNDTLFLNLTSLKELYLSHNQLGNITHEVLKTLTNLKKLDLSHNLLFMGSISESPLSVCSSLMDINLSHNHIDRVYEDWRKSFPNLKRLDLSYNKLTKLTGEDFQFHITGSQNISYSSNSITSIDLTGIEPYNTSDIRFCINNNPIQCDCKTLKLAEYVQKDAFKLKIIANNVNCNGPKLLKNKSLKMVNPMELKCPLYEIHPELNGSCPNTCDCDFRSKDNVLEVNCTSRGMAEFPTQIPTTNYDVELLFDGNNLTSIAGLSKITENVRKHVIQLSLSGNQLDNVDGLELLTKLKILKLDNNLLTYLKEPLISHFKSLENLNMTLYKNPWECNCDTIPLWQFISETPPNKIQRKGDIQCSDNRSIHSLTQNDLCDQTSIYVFVILGLSFGVVICVLITLYFVNQHKIKVWMFTHKCLRWLVTEREIDKNKIYDAFVSFSHVDQEFVDNYLIPKLEKNNEENYKLCIHYRDFVVGEYIPEQITYAVENSRRTIIVLSPHFLTSFWGQLEWRTAHLQAIKENCARVIVIMYQDVTEKDLDRELRAYITMNTYLEWGSKYFWNNLKYALGLPVDRLKRKERIDLDMEPLRETKIIS